MDDGLAAEFGLHLHLMSQWSCCMHTRIFEGDGFKGFQYPTLSEV